MTYTNRPGFYFGAAFNAAPNDTVNIPIWSDLTTSVRSVDGVVRGRQYELAQTLAADPVVVIRDPAEALNPDNTGSPFNGEIEPYKPVVWVGQWPNYGDGVTPPSGQTNLLNLNTWGNPIDSSFESYPNGTIPEFITAVGTSATGVVTANPHTGTKSFQFNVQDNPNLQTVSWPLKCIPGHTYTASFWLRTSQITAPGGVFPLVLGRTQTEDQFQRTVANGWGVTAPLPVGGTYTTSGGAAADYGVDGSRGFHNQNSANVARATFRGSGLTDHNAAAYVDFGGITVLSGAPVRAGVAARVGVPLTGYVAVGQFNPDNSINLLIVKILSGTETILGTLTTPYTYDPTIRYGIRIDTQQTRIQAKIWPETIPEPVAYMMLVTDSAIGPNVAAGCYSKRETGNTNSPFHINFDSFNVIAAQQGAFGTAVGSYMQLSVTFTADQPDHAVSFTSTQTGLGTTNVINLDDLQCDEAATVQARATTGPTIYPILRNFAERWTRSWDDSGYEGIATVPCVDAIAALSATTIGVEYQAALDATFPFYSYPLSDSSDGVTFGEVIQGGPSLVATNGRNVTLNGVLTPGIPVGIPGNPGSTGVAIAGNNSGFQGLSLVASKVPIPGDAAPVAVTVAFWLHNNDNAATTAFVMLANKNGSYMGVRRDGGGGTPFVPYATAKLANPASGTGIVESGNATQQFTGGGMNFYVATFQQAGTNFTTSLWVNGNVENVNVTPTVTAFGTSTPNFMFNEIVVAGGDVGGQFGNGVNGTYAQVHMWPRVINSTEIQKLYQAGLGFAGELTGNRIARHLALGGYAGAQRIDPGTQMLGPPSYSPTIDLATDAANTATAENGDFWIAPDGAAVFEQSTDRYLRLTSTWKLGERATSGESQYQSSITYDDDPTYIYANVQIARPNGINAVGGSPTDIALANRKFFGRSLAATADLQTDTQAQDLANWTFYTHNRPIARLASVALDPSSNPALWPVVLGMELSQRVTVVRRPSAANAGAGFTDSADFFVEQISHDQIDMDAGTWTTTLVLSPIGSATSGSGLTFQPWIVGDATYGVVGVTTIPAY